MLQAQEDRALFAGAMLAKAASIQHKQQALWHNMPEAV
jgi:hypothetical protein